MGASPRGVDWDEDGDIDLISGEYNGKVILFLNVGTSPTNPVLLTKAGYIQANNVDIDVGNLSNPVVDDWDEDGRKDLIVGCDAGYVYVYLNTGTNAAPLFGSSFKIEADGSAVYYRKNCPRIADLNEDGLKDLVLSGLEGNCFYWPNFGTNATPVFHEKYDLYHFQAPIDPDPGAYNWCHFDVCDWNEDGRPDLLYTRWESDIQVHLHGTHDLTCLLEPVNPPIVIPSQGGSFQCRVIMANTGKYDAILDAWTEVGLPGGGLYGPWRQKTAVILPAGATWKIPLSETVWGFVPPGVYSYGLCLGKMGNGCFLRDSFDFTKQ